MWFCHAEQYDSRLLRNEMYASWAQPYFHNCNTVHQNKTPNTDSALSMRLEMCECYSKYSQSCSKDEKIHIIIQTKIIIVCTRCRNRPDYCLFLYFRLLFTSWVYSGRMKLWAKEITETEVWRTLKQDWAANIVTTGSHIQLPVPIINWAPFRNWKKGLQFLDCVHISDRVGLSSRTF